MKAKSQVKDADNVLKALEKEKTINQDFRATIAGYESKMAFLEKKNGELEIKLNSVSELNARNDQEKIFLREKLVELQETIAKLTDSNKIQTEKLHEYTIHTNSLENQNKDQSNELKNLKSQLRQSEDQREELNIKYLEVIQKKTELKGQLRVFERLFQEKDMANLELQNNIQKLQSARDELIIAMEEKKFGLSSRKLYLSFLWDIPRYIHIYNTLKDIFIFFIK